MSVKDPPQFNTSIFNNSAFIDTSGTLSIDDANRLYIRKDNPSISAVTSITGTVSEMLLISSNYQDCIMSLNATNTNGRKYQIGSSTSLSAFSPGSFYIYDATTSNNRLLINNSGNVGIANNSPSYKLDVTGTTKTTQLLVGDSIDTAGSRLISALDNSLTTGNSKFFCLGKSNTLNNQAEISFYMNGDGSATNFLAFGLYGSTTAYITGNSRVGIGISSPSYQFQISTDSAAKPSTNTWTVSSDERIKEDIEDANLDICYNNIKNLKLKRYKWIDSFIENHSIEDQHKLGWIAQEVETIIPKAVITTNNEEYNIEDFKSLNADQIYASLYGAVQKIINKLENIENFIATLDIEE